MEGFPTLKHLIRERDWMVKEAYLMVKINENFHEFLFDSFYGQEKFLSSHISVLVVLVLRLHRGRLHIFYPLVALLRTYFLLLFEDLFG
jgi:hypothetical protein